MNYYPVDPCVHVDAFFTVDPDTKIEVEEEDGFPVVAIGEPAHVRIRLEGNTAGALGRALQDAR